MCAASAEETRIVFCVNIQPQLPLEFWQSIADRFMATRPDAKVEIIGNPSSNVTLPQYEKTLLATDQFPDVMVMQNPADFVPSGALLAFDDGDLDYLANPDLVKAMEKYQTVCTRYCGQNTTGVTYTQMLELFFTGKAAMLPIGSWVNAEVAKAEHDFEVGWFPMPDDDDADIVSVYVNEGLSIGANTRCPEVCKDFIHFFFTDKELYGAFLESEQLFSTTREDVEYDMIPLRKDMGEQIAAMTEVEGFESMTGDDAFLPGLKDYYTNKMTQNIAIGMDVESALDDFDEEWEIAMEAIEDAA